MRLLKMDKPQCLLYSAAMVLDVSVKDIISAIGHDGMEIVNPSRPDNERYRSVHIQEIIDCFILRGFGLMPIERVCSIGYEFGGNIDVYGSRSDKRFKGYMHGREGIMIGSSKYRPNEPHSWAWDGKNCYDPNGFIADLDDYIIREAWMKVELI